MRSRPRIRVRTAAAVAAALVLAAGSRCAVCRAGGDRLTPGVPASGSRTRLTSGSPARRTWSGRSSSSSSRRSSGSRRRSRGGPSSGCWPRRSTPTATSTPSSTSCARISRARRGRCSRWSSRSPPCATTPPASRRRGSYEAVEALTRGGLAAGALAFYPEVFGSLAIGDELPDLRDHPRPRASARADRSCSRARRSRASRRSGSGRSRRSSRS